MRRGSDPLDSCSDSSSHVIPESTSEEGTVSRLPWLPSASQAKSAGAVPLDSIASSIVRRISGGPRLEVLHLRLLDKPLQGLLVESAERVVGSPEFRDVVQAATTRSGPSSRT
jgi:hypothetical protein